jgi:AraC-like DNA-binding protein
VLEESFGERLSLTDLAGAAGLTRVQTVRAFTRAYGVTPFAYLTAVRVANARKRLAEGEDVTRAAYASGFSDPSHLHRWFRRGYQTAPGAYARAVKR